LIPIRFDSIRIRIFAAGGGTDLAGRKFPYFKWGRHGVFPPHDASRREIDSEAMDWSGHTVQPASPVEERERLARFGSPLIVFMMVQGSIMVTLFPMFSVSPVIHRDDASDGGEQGEDSQ